MALNVHPELSHFDMIVPCGLHGRRVTSMREVLAAACPPSQDVALRLAAEVISALNGRYMRLSFDQLDVRLRAPTINRATTNPAQAEGPGTGAKSKKTPILGFEFG